MTSFNEATVFFDIGDTLADVRVDAAGERIVEMNVYPGVQSVLESLRRAGAQLGILSNPGTIPGQHVRAKLEQVGLMPFFKSNLVFFGPKDAPALFQRAASRARDDRFAHPVLLFVGDSAAERTVARTAGFLTAPHPVLILPVLQQRGPLRYLRVRPPRDLVERSWRTFLRVRPIVPLHVENGPDGPAVYAVADVRTAAELDGLGFLVDRLGAEDEPQVTEVHLHRRAFQRAASPVAAARVPRFGGQDPARQVLASTAEGVLASGPGRPAADRVDFAALVSEEIPELRPSLALLSAPLQTLRERPAHLATATSALNAAVLDQSTVDVLNEHVTDAAIADIVARYSGANPFPDGTVITSRHVNHPGNDDAVDALVDELQRVGAGRLQVARRPVSGGTYTNVEAVLPGTGLSGVVFVSAHLDAVAGHGHPAPDAPGADDDASGMAGVLRAASALAQLAADRHDSRREIRFVLFNGEEVPGQPGSESYAVEEIARGTQVAGVFHMDMIGFDGGQGCSWELHAATPLNSSPHVQARSVALADLVDMLARQVSGLNPPTRFNKPGHGAVGRSDHTNFHDVECPACLVSESSPGGGAGPCVNPHYHTPNDTVVNAAFAAEIARAVTAAAWVLATTP